MDQLRMVGGLTVSLDLTSEQSENLEEAVKQAWLLTRFHYPILGTKVCPFLSVRSNLNLD